MPSPLAAVLALLALLAPAALAQDGLGSVDLAPAPGARDAEPGGKAVFRVQVTNRHVLQQDVALVALPPAGWAFNATPANLTLSPGQSGNVTLEVFVPADARTNQTLALPLEARAHGTDLVLARGSVNVTVVPPPPPPGPGEPSPPALVVSVSDANGVPGQTVEALVTLRNDGPTALDVSLSGAGPAGWNPRFLPGDELHVLYPGDAPRVVRVYASIPAASQPGAFQDLSIVATVGQFGVPATWRVGTVSPPMPPEEQPAPGPGPSEDPGPAAQPGEVPQITPQPTTSLDARVVGTLLQVAPGESARGVLRLENTGTTPLSLRLVGSGPTDWAPPALDKAALDLAPGAVAEVGFTVRAPLDVIPSTAGRGAGSVMATAQGGLARTARFEVMVVPGAPRDVSPSDAETSGAVVSGEGGANLPFATVGFAAAFGAVGAGALALANRPLREKLLWGAVGLYTRLARPDVLGHEDRERLYKLIEATPGVHFHALQRDLAWNTGTLTYHLRVLERHGFVVSRRDGLYRRFYLQGSAPRKEVFENQGPQGLRADVLEAIRNRHGMSQSDLALALGANKQTVNYHVKALERQGVIRLEKRGRETFLYPSDAPSSGGEREASA